MASKPQLFYWDGRGRAEISRLLLAAGKIEFVEPMYMSQPADIAKLRSDGVLMFNQLPLLKWDGLNLVQTGATTRYIANRCGLHGGNDQERYQIDVLYEGTRDFMSPFIGIGFQPASAVAKNAQGTVIPKYMPIFEKQLKDNFLTCGKLTLADIGLLEVLLVIEEITPETFGQYPKLKEYLANLKKIPQLEAYLKGSQRKPLGDEKYAAAVMNTLK